MRAKPLFKTRFAVRPGKDSGADHWIGGDCAYKGAECPVCRARLHLLLDIDCEDSILRKASRGKLAPLARLPLLVCMRCACELSYHVDEGMRVKVIQTRYGYPGSEPYADYPDHFPRKPCSPDDSVPTALPRAIKKWDPDVDLVGDKLSKAER